MNEQQQQAVRELRAWENEAVDEPYLQKCIGVALSALDQAQRELAETKASKRRYPIQDGPSVPWEVMAPHESQAQKNHSQSLERLAERGGLGCAEAWAIVNGLECPINSPWAEWKQNWMAYAERINLHYEQLDQAQRERNELAAKLTELEASARGFEKLSRENGLLREAVNHNYERIKELEKCCAGPDFTPNPKLPPLGNKPRRKMLIEIEVDASFEKRLDNQWMVEREIHADRWQWRWA